MPMESVKTEIRIGYCYVDRQAWANSVEPDQTVPDCSSLIWVYTVCHSVCIFWIVKQFCSIWGWLHLYFMCPNFRIFIVCLAGCRMAMILLDWWKSLWLCWVLPGRKPRRHVYSWRCSNDPNTWAHSVDPDLTVPEGAVLVGATMFILPKLN